MADPASLFSIISGTVGLVAQCSRTICRLHTISERFKYAKLTVGSMSLGLETIQWTWTRIGIILEGWANEHEVRQDETDDIIAQINRSLSGGTLVISALEQDLKPYDTTSEHALFGLRTRVKVLWNEQTLRDHQERLRDQVNSMNLLLNVLRLPEATARKNLLAEGQGVFRKSDESAYSIVPSRAPDSIRNRFSRLSSMKSEKSLAYHELSIDDDLFTARVYKRNYRTTAMIRKMFHSPRQSYASQGLPCVEDTNIPQISSPEQEPRREETCLLEVGSTSGTYYPAEMLGLQSTNINTFKGLPELSTGMDAQPEFWKPTKWIVGIKKQRTIEGPPSFPALLHAGWKERSRRNDNSPPDLTSAVEHSDIALFRDLLRRWNCIPGLWLHHCLMTACAQGRENLARLLLNYPIAVPAVDGLEKLYGASSPIKLALRRRDLSIVKLLLQDPQTRHSCRSMDFLFIVAAIELDDAPFLQHTIDHDANIHQEISPGSQAVHLACQHRSFLCLGILIKAGAFVSFVYFLSVFQTTIASVE
ncbi:MAG: hypothetical protein Q9215_003087 [Flavoplaca cf. flavocitrina]